MYRYFPYLGIIIVSIFLVGCGTALPRFTSERFAKPTIDNYSIIEDGIASYYAEEFNGKQTSSGEIYDMNQMTAAHQTLPFNTRVQITNLDNGKSIVVRINDRGPFKDNRIIDLSYAAAKSLGMISAGTAKVRLEVLELGNAP